MIGHVEVVRFLRVERVPAAGEIVHARESWEEAAGGGAVAAAELARLGVETLFLTALGDDEAGRRAADELRARRVDVRAALRGETRHAVTFVDADGERTIAVDGPGKLVPQRGDPLPWDELADCDGVYFVSGDPDGLRAARAAPLVVATARELPTLRASGVELDVLVASAGDAGERYEAGDLDPPPRVVVRTEGAAGGVAEPGGRWRAAPLPGPPVDAYGCGDCFAAALALALASGRPLAAALDEAAARGAAALTKRGANG